MSGMRKVSVQMPDAYGFYEEARKELSNLHNMEVRSLDLVGVGFDERHGGLFWLFESECVARSHRSSASTPGVGPLPTV